MFKFKHFLQVNFSDWLASILFLVYFTFSMIMFLADSMLSLEPRKMILVSYAWDYDVCDESEEDGEDVQVDHLGL